MAVTGGLACGKSTVCRLLEQSGAYVVNADAIVHHLLSQDSDLTGRIIELLGPGVVVHGKLDRQTIAKTVFSTPCQLKKLESLLHPAVQAEIEKQYERVEKSGLFSLFVAEVPLLFEAEGMSAFYDQTVVVSSEEKLCRKRFMQKTGLPSRAYEERTSRLLPLSEKEKLADLVIHNNKDLQSLEKEVKKLYIALAR